MTLAEDLSSIQIILTRYILPIFFIFGIIGNLLNIIVFCQKHLRTNSCSIYFTSTSIFNFLVICFGLVPIVLSSYLSYDYSSYSISYCKFRSYIVHVFLMISRSSVALASIDRFAICSRNIHIRCLNQYHVAIRLIVVVCFLWFLIPIHMLVLVSIQIPGQRCGAGGSYSIIYGIYSAIVTAIPLLIMIIFSSLAMRDLRHVRLRVQPIAKVINNINIQSRIRIKKRDTQFLILLISEVIIYFLSTVLFPIYSIYIAITSTITKNSDRLAIEGFIRYLTLTFLLYVNSCSIFYVHLLASKAFRQEFKQLFLYLNKPKPRNTLPLTATGISVNKRQVDRTHHEHQPI